ncbi:hypothetical protein Tco_0708232 [Tanacetum coccineum]
MSTLAYVDSETITQADGVQSSRVPVPLPDDPHVAVRQAYEEFEASKPSGTRTISSHFPVSSDSTTPLSPDHPLTHVSPTLTPTRVSFHCKTARIAMLTQQTLSLGMSSRIAEAAALSLSYFCKRYISSYEILSSSLTLPVRKRYRGTSELILDTDREGDELREEGTEEDADDERESQGLDDEGQGLDNEGHSLDDESQGLEDEGLGLEEEEVVPDGQQQAVPVVETATSEPLGLGYGALRHRELTVGNDRVYTDILAYVPLAAPVQTPSSLEWSFGSLPVLPSSPVVLSPIASPVATLTATISVDKDQFIEVRRDMSRARYDNHILFHDMLVQQAAMQRELQEMRGRVTALE